MLKWLLVLAVALVVLSGAAPWLARRGLGRLPGDVVVQFRGRSYYIPFTSTVLLSLALTCISRWI